MSRPASLAMYDPGGAVPAALWEALRENLEDAGISDVPRDLTLPTDYERHWLDSELLVAQTCGYPLTHSLAGRVTYLGTPIYDVDGTDGPYYRSAIVVRAEDPASGVADLRGYRAAYNGATSQSGYNALRAAAAPHSRDGRFFSDVIETGSHVASLSHVIDGRADVAAIDPVTLSLQATATRSRVRLVAWTDPTPGLPLITALRTSSADTAALRSTIAETLQAGELAETKAALKLVDFIVLPISSYDSIVEMEQRASDHAYPLLA